MLVWIYRALILILGPVLSFSLIAHSREGILIGLGFAVAIIVLEIFILTIPLDTLIFAILGVVLGLIGAKVLDYTIFLTDNERLYAFFKEYALLVKIVLSYFGLVVAVRKKSELDVLDKDILSRGRRKQTGEVTVLDTSALIDGRVADIAATRFLTGVLVAPRFMLSELQKLADSSDTHKRGRARRGLDILARLQKEDGVTVKIFDKDFPNIPETDSKIVQLARDLSARILTTDFNLNKIAALQGVTALNINDLANALRPVYLPGETMQIYLAKEGKESSQAVGYQDDGTMVVVENGRRFLGKRVEVIVSSILQTSSGRMVFAQTTGEAIPEQRAHNRSVP